jgi:hypothetical protein
MNWPPVTIDAAPAVLNTNDKAMWALGFNEALETIRAAQPGQLGPVFHVSRVGVSSEFGGDTYTLKLHCHDRDHAETLKRRLLEERMMPGPFPAQFAEQAESIDTGKLAQAMSWLGLSAPSGEMLSWWVGREVNRLLDAVLDQREAMRDVQPVAWIVYAPNGNVRLWSTEQRQANECAEANGLTVTPVYASRSSAVPSGVRENSNG